MSLRNPDPPAHQVEDELPMRKLLVITAVTLAIFGLGILWSWRILVSGMRADVPEGPAPIPPALGRFEQGIVFQIPFDQTVSARREAEAGARQLERYGWIDRDRGVIHLPIGVAMDRILAGERP